MKNQRFIFWLTVMALGAGAAVVDSHDFPQLVNQATGWPHHWLVGLGVAIVSFAMLYKKLK